MSRFLYDDENTQSISEIRRKFIERYLRDLGVTLGRFGSFFSVVSFIYIAQTLLNILFVFVLIGNLEENGGSVIGVVQLIAIAINLALVVWFAIICRGLVDIQVSKVQNDAQFNQKTYEEGVNVTKELLERARKRVGDVLQTISIYGDVSSPFTVTGIGDANVNVNAGDESKETLKKAVALLVAYCEESHNEEAIRNAKSIAAEASKKDRNKTVIMTCWTKIVALIPTVADVFTIVEGINHLVAL